MKETVTLSRFRDVFAMSDTYKNNFSYEGLAALFEYLEQYEEDTGEEMEFDMVALCCEYSEYKDIEEIKEQYSNVEDIEDLEMETVVIPFDDGIIIQDF